MFLLQVHGLLSQSLCLSSSCFLGLGLRGRWRKHGPEGPRSENGTDEGAYPVHIQLLPGVVLIVNIRPTKRVGRVHGGSGVCGAGEDEADGGDGEHGCLDNGVAGSLDDDAEDGKGDDEGEHPFGGGAGVGIHLERGSAEHVLVLLGHQLGDGQSSAHGSGGLRW